MSHLQDSSDGGGKTVVSDLPAVLIVEDDECLCRTLARVLERIGFRAVVAPSSARAVDLVREHDVCVALIDWHLSGGTGAVVLADLRASCGSDLHAIVLSGSRNREVKREALAAGADDFVCKPLNLAELRRLLESGSARRGRK